MTGPAGLSETRLLIAPEDRSMPFDVAVAVLRAVNVLYPNARVGSGDERGGFTVIIDPADRAVDHFDPGMVAAVKTPADTGPGADERGLIGWRHGVLSADTGDEYRQRLAEWAYQMLTAADGAINYVQQDATLPGGRKLSVVACWSEQQTPHALRMAAERRAEAAEKENRRLKTELDSLRKTGV